MLALFLMLLLPYNAQKCASIIQQALYITLQVLPFLGYLTFQFYCTLKLIFYTPKQRQGLHDCMPCSVRVKRE